MNFDEYQELARVTANGVEEEDKLLFSGICIAGEAGELANVIKKIVYHGHKKDAIKLMDEAGDILWYLSFLADAIGFSLEDIAKYNIEKLKRRYPDGFSKDKSINRKENTI